MQSGNVHTNRHEKHRHIYPSANVTVMRTHGALQQSVEGKQPRGDIGTQPVDRFHKVVASDGAASKYAPVVGLQMTQTQQLQCIPRYYALVNKVMSQQPFEKKVSSNTAEG